METTKELANVASPKSPHKDTMHYIEVSSPVKPSAPPAEWPPTPRGGDATTTTTAPAEPTPWPEIAPPELLPPSARAKRGLAWLTLKLIPYHLLNFALGLGGFIVVVMGVSMAGMLLPLCCLGVPIYFLLLQLTRAMVAMDIALANTITRPQAAARWIAPDSIEDAVDDGSSFRGYELRIAPKLTRPSVRSTLILLYFATIKFALGVGSCVVVILPFMPLAAEIESHTSTTDPPINPGWNIHKFNFSTHPVWYTMVFTTCTFVGTVLMHFLGLLSRETTRRVCCVEAVVPPHEGAVLPGDV